MSDWKPAQGQNEDGVDENGFNRHGLRGPIGPSEYEKLANAIREHRDQRGDDRCWMDDEKLYQALPEGYTPPARDSKVELALCEKYISCRHNPGTAYVSPQRRIEELEAEIKRLRQQ